MVSVQDEGIGISQQNLNSLFEFFYRIEDGVKGVSGFGIGLYLFKEIIHRYQVKIWPESTLGERSFNFTDNLFGSVNNLIIMDNQFVNLKLIFYIKVIWKLFH